MAIADEITADTLAATGGGNPVPAPKNYVPTSPAQRSDWNGFVDYLGKQGVNVNDPQAAQTYLQQYKKANPNFSITPDLIPAIQYEQSQFRTGDTFGSLNADQLKAARQGMSPNFLNQTNLYQQRYPQFKSGSQDFGTDVEGYMKFKSNGGQTAGPSTIPVASAAPVAKPTGGGPGTIPLPNYDDPKSRAAYLDKFAPKYGNFVHNRGDTIIHVNEVPEGGTIPIGQSAKQAASKLGLDPALLYSSAMEEGASGMFPDKPGEHVDKGEFTTDKYPVDGYANYGLDNFHDNFKEMVKRGYLPQDFDYQKSVRTNELGAKVNSAIFKTPEDAMTAKAAYMKLEQDHIDDYAKQKSIQLSDRARQFFTLVNFNGGPGAGPKMLNYYAKKGLLKDEKFVDTPPEPGLGLGEYYEHIHPRMQMADLLKKENLLQ